MQLRPASSHRASRLWLEHGTWADARVPAPQAPALPGAATRSLPALPQRPRNSFRGLSAHSLHSKPSSLEEQGVCENPSLVLPGLG